MKIEDPGSRIEHRASSIEHQSSLDPPGSFLNSPSSILHPRSSILVGKRPRRLWRDKFREAVRGMKLGVRGHSSFFVHFFFAALVVMTAIVLRCELFEWCLLLGCIGLVLTAELFNSAVETIYRGLDEVTKHRVRHCLDIAAGAVLLASITAAIIGGTVFVPKVASLLVHWIS
jgi:diacylglycerol kinase